MEMKRYFADEETAKEVCWFILKLGERAKIDGVLTAGVRAPYAYEVSFRCWDEKVLDEILDHMVAERFDNSFECEDADDGSYEQEVARRDAILLEACAKATMLKAALIEDAGSCDSVDELVYALAMSLTDSRPGPSESTLNFVMEKLGREERFGSYV